MYNKRKRTFIWIIHIHFNAYCRSRSIHLYQTFFHLQLPKLTTTTWMNSLQSSPYNTAWDTQTHTLSLYLYLYLEVCTFNVSHWRISHHFESVLVLHSIIFIVPISLNKTIPNQHRKYYNLKKLRLFIKRISI